jgi:hypothetical protein
MQQPASCPPRRVRAVACVRRPRSCCTLSISGLGSVSDVEISLLQIVILYQYIKNTIIGSSASSWSDLQAGACAACACASVRCAHGWRAYRASEGGNTEQVRAGGARVSGGHAIGWWRTRGVRRAESGAQACGGEQRVGAWRRAGRRKSSERDAATSRSQRSSARRAKR